MRLKLLAILSLFLTSHIAMIAQNEEISREVKIHFALGSYDLDSDSLNANNLITVYELIDSLNRDSLCAITKIKINSYASPESGYTYNQTLTRRRTHSIYKQLITSVLPPPISCDLIETSFSGIDWEQLHQLVSESDMQYRDEVLCILKNEPEETWGRVKPTDRWLTLIDSRNKRLMDLRGGKPYRYMSTHFFPKLRHGSIVTIYTQRVMPLQLEFKEIEVTHQELTTLPEPELTPVESIHSLPFAVKTNLLYDLALTPSVELEIPLGKRWSVAGEWIFPWWVTKDNGNALQILSGQVEGRYWLGNRELHAQLTGWFAGLYAGGGLYDLQYQNNGYQGEFYIAAGLSAGYAHTINKSKTLRMEYTVGVGYLSTDYRYYEGKQDNEYLVWQYDGSYTWLGPTKVEISLVWFINLKWRGGAR